MRFPFAILLAWFCFLQNVPGFGTGQVFGSPDPGQAAPVAETLTNIAGCLQQVRSRPGQPVSLKVQACVTLIDRERSLIVLQDDSAAMAIHTSLSSVACKPGQRVLVDGDGIFPYVHAFPAYPNEPSGRDYLGSFEEPPKSKSYYLTRIRGYLHPPVSGQYTFWIAADDAGEFWLSPDASPEKREKIASNRIGNATRPREWSRYPSQQSRPVMLKAGQDYYVEALHVQSAGSNCMAVAWAGPGIARAVIDGSYLTPWVEPATGRRLSPDRPLPAQGLSWEWWTNFFVRDFEALRPQNPDESFVRIHSLKLTEVGDTEMPVPLPIEPEGSLSEVPNLHWAELEGDVTFAAGTGDQFQIELKREDSVLGVRILNRTRLSTERLMHSRVRIRGVLEHANDADDELAGSVLWVPDDRQVAFLDSAENPAEILGRVSICEIRPSNPEMRWGRRVNVRGRIVNRTTNGLVILRGNDNYQALCSADGTNWVALGKPVEIGMSNSVLAGLALSSHNDVDSVMASFKHLEGFGTNWHEAGIGKPAHPGSFGTNGGLLTLQGSGRGIRMRADQQYYLYQTLTNGASICAQLTDLPGQLDHAQAGLMFRESLDRKARYAAVLFAPVTGVAFQYRPAYGGDSAGSEAISEHRQFRWMKLMKRESLLLVQTEPGTEISTNGEVEATGMITWRNGTPILSDAFFQTAQPDNPPVEPVVSEPQPAISIANFVARAQHPVEPYLFHSMEALKLRGIVTFCGDFLGSNIMFVQAGDESGIRVGWLAADIKPGFEVGQLVEMSGYSHVRQFPVVLEPSSIVATGWGTLPEPVQYSSSLVTGGSGQARWVEATGVVRAEETNGLLNLMTKDGLLAVWVGRKQATNGEEYVDDLVRLRGVLSMDSARVAQLLVPSPEFVEVQERAPADPFAIPGFSIAELDGMDAGPERLRRMKSGGVVTCTLPQGVYVQDDTGGVYVQTSEATSLRPGDRVEVVGFPDNESGAVRLNGALVRKSGAGNLPHPIRTSIDELTDDKFVGMFVSLDARLIGQRDTEGAQMLTLQTGTKVFEAARLADQFGRLPAIPIGSRVAITGVCEMDPVVMRDGLAKLEVAQPASAFKIWLPSPASVVLLERPPWWTLKRVVWLGSIFVPGLLGALIWVRLLRQRVAQKTRELQATMQRLEKETRTSAVLAERDRLAGEIHDSLEQGLAAIMLQLDAANKHADQSPEIRRFLHMARNMAEFSRAEVQHAVWDLQSPLLENADLGTALKHVAGQISSGSPEVKVEISGLPRPLPSSHEHHLLRIAQEAITNAFKHAQARSIEVALDYSGTDLRLTVTDNGRGFIPGDVKQQGRNGHFGLHGILARAKKIGARLDISSQAKIGTVIKVQMKLNDESRGVASKEPESL